MEYLFVCLLVLINGLLTMTETAVVAASKSKLRRLALLGNKRAVSALALAEYPSRFLALVQFWLTLSTVIAGVVTGARLSSSVAEWLGQFSGFEPYVQPVAFALVILGLASFMLLFGALVPKRVGLAYPETVAMLFAGGMRGLAWLAAPFLSVFNLATALVLRILRVRPVPAEAAVSDDDVRALVDRGLHGGVFQRAEKEMVEGVLSLDQLPVTAIMTPRPKIVFLNLDDTDEVNWRKIVTSGHSHFPVYQTNRDQVIGMVAVKALWAHSAIGLPTTLKNLINSPLFVPETMMANLLLERFKKSGKHTAIVTDEFGTVQGLVTLIDVMEAIVGDLPQPGDRTQPVARKQPDGSLLIDAILPVGELKELLGTTGALPNENEADFQTLGGFLMTQFGRIPKAGDHFHYQGWRFEVTEMERHRVDKVLLRRETAEAEERLENSA